MIYDFTLQANVGAAQRIDAMGRRISLLSCNLSSVDVVIDGSNKLRMRPGQTYTMPEGRTFREVVVVNRQNAMAIGDVYIGDGSLTDTAIAGDVSTMSGESARTVSDTAFMVAMAHTAAANLPAVQLFTKPANTRRAAVSRVMVCSSLQGNIALYRYSAYLANLNAANPPVSKFAQSIGWNPANELESRYEELPATVGTMIGLVIVPANGQAVFDLSTPVVLDPGQGLMVIGTAAASKVVATMDGYMLD